MTPAERQIVVNEFMDYLNARDLCICNFSKNIVAYWPIDTESLMERFANQ